MSQFSYHSGYFMTYVIKPQISNSDNFAERQPDSQHSARLEGFPLNFTTPQGDTKISHNNQAKRSFDLYDLIGQA